MSHNPKTKECLHTTHKWLQKCVNTSKYSQVFPCHCAGADPDAGPGPRLPHHREALHKCLTSLLSFSSYELCVLQPFYLRLTAQQGAHAPERLPLSLSSSSEGDGGEGVVQELILVRALFDITGCYSIA